MKLRQPSAGNERIRIDEVRRIVKNGHEMLDRLDDEAMRALAVAREWEGNAKAASWDTVDEPLLDGVEIDTEPGELSHVRRDALTADGDPDVSPQHTDRTGEAAMRPDEMAAIYEVFVHEIRETEIHLNLVGHCLGKIRKSDMDAAETARLQRVNSNAGLCDACGDYHDPSKDRDNRLRPAGSDRMYGPDCYRAWLRAQQSEPPTPRSVFERQRAKRVAPQQAS